jgi:hypothetical protein
MTKITMSEFQSNFDKIISEVESGKSFIVQSQYGDVALVPHFKTKDTDELVKIYTDHEEGC